MNDLECCFSVKRNEAADFVDSDFSAHINVEKVDNIRATCDYVVKCETIQSTGTTF